MNTQKKLYLLPYRWQIIGWIILGASLLATIVGLLLSKNPNDQMATVYLGSFLFALLGMLIAGLSREKQEDEFTVFLRTRSALTAIAIMLGLRLVFTLGFSIFAVSVSAETYTNSLIHRLAPALKEMTNYGGAFALYLILYKVRLVKYNLQLAKEEQEVE
jgi:tetrahydromethanopterin S-methyltransferase subunit C